VRRNLIAVAVMLGCGCKHAAEEEAAEKPAAAAVTCAPVEAAEIEDIVDVSGVVAPPPKLDAMVSSPIAGRVAQVAVDEGDHVAAGALLALIEDPALPAGSLEAKANVAAAQATKIAADQDVTRQERLVASGIGARKDLDDAKAKAAAAAAELDAARARSGLATSQLSRREIRSPRAGVVLHLYRKVGETVDGTGATPIAEVADISTLELHAQVAPQMLSRIAENMPARVRVLGLDAPVAGTVTRVAPAVNATTLLGLVRVTLASSTGIKVGTSGSAQISVEKRPGIRVPASALRRSMVGEDEVVVCKGGVVHVQEVKVGARDERGVAILEGLAAGDRIVTDHALGLEDGQPLTESKEKK